MQPTSWSPRSAIQSRSRGVRVRTKRPRGSATYASKVMSKPESRAYVTPCRCTIAPMSPGRRSQRTVISEGSVSRIWMSEHSSRGARGLRALLGFEARDLVDAAGVAAAVERCVQPDAHHLVHELFAQEIGGQADHVAVVVAAAHLGGDGIVAGGGADAAHLVRGNAHTDVRAADEYAALDLAAADGLADEKREIRVVRALRAGGTHVEHFMP